MKKRLILAAICIFTLPFWSSYSLNPRTINTAPANNVVFAGHNYGGGGWCECGSAECICDPGERPQALQRPVAAPAKTTTSSSWMFALFTHQAEQANGSTKMAFSKGRS